jgi:hypothetical protein
MDAERVKMILFNMELLVDALKKETQQEQKSEKSLLQEVPEYTYQNLPIDDYDEIYDPNFDD